MIIAIIMIISKKKDQMKHGICCFETVIGTWPEGLGLFSCLRSREKEEEEEEEVDKEGAPLHTCNGSPEFRRDSRIVA